jgi:integrase
MSARRGSGDGSIYRQGDRWVACVTIASSAGHQVRRKRMARTYAEARTKLRELQTETAAGVVGAGRLTVAAYLKDWLAHVLPARPVSVATVENYTTMVNHHIIPAIGGVRLERLRADDVDRLLRNMAADGKARSTIRLARGVLVSALNHAERRDMVSRNAARLAVVPPAPKRESRSLTVDQARSLLSAIRGERLEAAWVTMLLLGLRPGEVFALSWGDVDFDTGVLHVRRSIRRAGGATFTLGDPKTARSWRSLDMPGLVVESLRSHRARQAAERLAVGDEWVDTGLVFTTAIGTMLDPANTRRAFGKVTEAAGLGRWHPHEARHSTVSLLSAGGVRLEEVADVVGHAPGSKMTGNVYRHKVNPSVSAARMTMDELFGSGSAAPA